MRSWQCHYYVLRTVKKHARTVANDPSWHSELNKGLLIPIHRVLLFLYGAEHRTSGNCRIIPESDISPTRFRRGDPPIHKPKKKKKPNPTFRCDGCDGGPVTYQTRRSVEILDGFLTRTVDMITPCCWTCITWFSASSRIRRIHTE